MNTTGIYRSEQAEKRMAEIYTHTLSGWPVGHDEIFVETRFGRTFAIASGNHDAGAMVLLHGSGSNALAWGADVAMLSSRYRVYALDIVGEAGRSSHTRLAWESEPHNNWLDDVLKGLGIDSCVLVGNSYGGWIALNYAALNPGKVSSLALISTCDSSAIKPSYIGKIIFYSLLGGYGKSRLKKMFFGDIDLPGEVAEFFDLCASSFIYRQGFPPVTPDTELSKLNMPVLYLAGAHDQIFYPEKYAKRLTGIVPHTKVRISEDDKHVLVHNAREILDFLGNGGKITQSAQRED
jgi:pimeloyl-ACP methyl ester carboxylesterase